METRKLFSVLVKNYNLYYILETLLGTKDLDPVFLRSPQGNCIGFNIEGRVVRLYLKSLNDDLVLLDESCDSISETYINVINGQTETITMKRQEDSLKVIRTERFYELEDRTISYVEEDHKTYSFDKLRIIYNIPNADFEFSRMKKFLNSFKYIDEDALVEGIQEDRHDTLLIYDNKYMKLIDGDIFVKVNDQAMKIKYGDTCFDFLDNESVRKLMK